MRTFFDRQLLRDNKTIDRINKAIEKREAKEIDRQLKKWNKENKREAKMWDKEMRKN